MSVSRLAELVALAREPSSERRRTLLREITDVFLEPAPGAPPAADDPAAALFAEVAGRLSTELDEAVRAEWAARVAPSDRTPYALAVRLANDDSIAVADPVIRLSPVLDEAALLEVVRTKGAAHLASMSARLNLPASVSSVVAERGDDRALLTLLRNTTANLDREGAERLVARAEPRPHLHEAAVARRDLPPDVLNTLYFAVESRLRYEILARNAELTPAEADAAIAAARQAAVLHLRNGGSAPEREEAGKSAAATPAADPHGPAARAAAARLRAGGPVAPEQLVALLRRGERPVVEILLGEAAGVDAALVARVFARGDLDALAVLCRAAGWAKPLFLTFAIALAGKDAPDPVLKAREYAPLYDQLTPDTAERTLRFWGARAALAA